VAVNGVIRGVATTYRSGGEVRFGALVPASSFTRGRNDVSILAISGTGRARRLSSVADAPLS
jgi:hypothetical protein